MDTSFIQGLLFAALAAALLYASFKYASKIIFKAVYMTAAIYMLLEVLYALVKQIKPFHYLSDYPGMLSLISYVGIFEAFGLYVGIRSVGFAFCYLHSLGK